MIPTINIYSIPPIISASMFLLLGVFVFLKNKKTYSNILFVLLCFLTVWWQGSWFFLFNINDPEWADFLVRLGYVGITLIPVIFFHFILSFLKKRRTLDKIFLFLFYPISFLLVASLFFSNYFIAGFYEYFWGFYPNAGPFHILYLFILFVVFFRIIYLLLDNLFKEKTKYSEHEKHQLNYFLLGITFYTLASFDFLANYGVGIYPFGFVFILTFLSIIAYAIIKYKLFNVRIVVTEILVASFSVLLFVNVFLASSLFGYTWRTFIFLVFLVLGGMLIKSVLREIRAYEEIEEYAEQLKTANIKLKQLNRQKNEFMSFAAHQLKSPLTSVKGFTNLLLDESFGKVPPKIKDIVEKMHSATNSMVDLVEDYLNISRIDQGKMSYHYSSFDLYQLARSVTEELKSSAYKKNQKVEVRSDRSKRYMVKADQGKIKQVIGNFVDNAIKYTQEGGKITVYVSKIKSRKVIRVAIKDNGSGIEKDNIEEIFKRYSRADNTKKAVGSGLGLYIARQMVEDQKGSAWAESKGLGKGSTFFVELPEKK